jgi:hypothetical protein
LSTSTKLLPLVRWAKVGAELEQVLPILLQRLCVAVGHIDELVDELGVGRGRDGRHPVQAAVHCYFHEGEVAREQTAKSASNWARTLNEGRFRFMGTTTGSSPVPPITERPAQAGFFF